LKTGDVAAARASALMERLMLGLRTRDGIDLDALAAEFGRSVPDEILAVLAEQPEGLAVVATRDVERDAADETTFSSFSLKNQDDERDGVSRLAGAVVRLTDPEGLMVSTEVISTLIARMPSLEAL
jgi:oxygen-independent coproporphyrinogen-3 oxidase